MGTKKTTTNTYKQEENRAPPSWTMPGISDAASRVTQAIAQLPGERYTGDFVAQPNMDWVQQATDLYRGAAGQSTGFGDMVAATLPQLTQAPTFGGPQLRTGAFNVGSGVDINPVIQAAIDPVTRNLRESILPSIRSGAIESGAYSGSRAMQVLPNQALDDWGREAGRLSSQIAYQDYNDRENRRLQADALDTQAFQAATQRGLGEADVVQRGLALLPQLANESMALRTAGGDLMMQATQAQAAARQAQLDNAIAQNNYSWMYPFQGLDIGAQLLAQLSGNYGTTTSSGSSRSVEKTGGAGAVASGLMGAAAMGASMFGAGGPLAAAGALGGASGAAGTASNLFRPGASLVNIPSFGVRTGF